MRHKVTLRQELEVTVVIEAPHDATYEQLAELALAKVDEGETCFECTGVETTTGPPDDGPPIDGSNKDRWHAYAYSRMHGEKS
jgi:hypothetical protein